MKYFLILAMICLPMISSAQIFREYMLSDFSLVSDVISLEEQTFLYGSDPVKTELIEKRKMSFGNNGITELRTEQLAGEKGVTVCAYTYDKNGLKKVLEMVNEKQGALTEYFYKEGKVVRIFEKRDAMQLTNRNSLIWYDDGQIDRIESKDEEGGFFSSLTKYIYLGSEEDYFTEKTLYFQGSELVKTTKQFEDNRLSSTEVAEVNKDKKVYGYFYDNSGNLLHSKFNNAVIEIHEYVYDTRGNWIKQYMIGYDESFRNLIVKGIFRKITYQSAGKSSPSKESGSTEPDLTFMSECNKRHKKE